MKKRYLLQKRISEVMLLPEKAQLLHDIVTKSVHNAFLKLKKDKTTDTILIHVVLIEGDRQEQKELEHHYYSTFKYSHEGELKDLWKLEEIKSL